MKTKLLLAFAAILIASVFLIDRIPQDPSYHQFADARLLLGVDNFWNVVTNLPFLLTGAAGLMYLRVRDRQGIVDSLYPAYIVFFVGVFATGIGSSWYHLAPDNTTLVWDRLPMTIAFMALFAIVIGEYVCDQAARRLLIPLILIGTATVFYWQFSEGSGSGDLRPYALVQFLPIIIMPVILLSYPSPFNSRRYYWGMFLLYAVAKLFEFFDYNLYDDGSFLSGHSVKHLVAASAPAWFLYGIAHRKPVSIT